MVDRITPAASAATLVLAEKLLGQPDPAAIETEPFKQWVIEDDFAGPRPAWDKAGALLVNDVAPYEDMKLRMLNGAHSLIAYLGAVVGLSAVRDVMAEPAYRSLVALHMSHASLTLDKVDKQDAELYKAELLARFENPAIDHRCLQIAMDGSQKLPQRIFVPAKIRLDQAASTDTFALAAGLWFVYLQGENELGEIIECNDPQCEQLKQIVNSDGSIAERVAALGLLSGGSSGLFNSSAWVDQVAAIVEDLSANGVLMVISDMTTAKM